MILAIDLGGTNLRGGLVGDEGVIWSERHPSQEVFGAGLDSLASAIQTLLNRAEGRVDAIIMGFPGTVSNDRATVLTVTNIKGLDGFNFHDFCMEHFGIPGIADTDVNLLLRDHLTQLPQPTRVVCGFYLGTGLGNAIAIDGRIFTGAHGVSGELGHIPYGTGTHPCACGLPRCIEPEVSGMGLSRESDLHDGVDTVADFFLNAPTQAQDRFLRQAALALATEINILDPDTVILGGGVFEGDNFPRQRLQALVLENVRRPLPHDDINFMWVRSDICTGLRGAWTLYKETQQ